MTRLSTEDTAENRELEQLLSGSWHYCVDFRGLNTVASRDAYPLLLIEESIDGLADMQWFSTLDITSGYWQIPVADEE